MVHFECPASTLETNACERSSGIQMQERASDSQQDSRGQHGLRTGIVCSSHINKRSFPILLEIKI